MRFKILAWSGMLVVAMLAGAAFTISAVTIKPARTVGLQVVSAADPQGQPITSVLYYPSDAAAKLTWLGMALALLAQDGPVAAGLHPLILLSPGTGGSPTSHLDSAIALAEQGFIVAAIVHNGDNFQDQSAVGSSDWISSRARHVVKVTDFMLGSWSQRASVDASRIGVFGFSAGATTALLNVGAAPDSARVTQACATEPEFVCQLLKPGAVLSSPAPGEAHDPRIRAALIAAPGFGMAFTLEALANVAVPVDVWVGALDTSTPAPSNGAAIAERLPGRPDVHLVGGAGHFSFLAPCGVMGLLQPAMLCQDAKGFDRSAFHRSFNAELVAFFTRTLSGAGERRTALPDLAHP